MELLNDLRNNHSIFGIRPDIFIILFLIVITRIAYGPVSECEFINFDDNEYVTDNYFIKQGLTSEGIRWAFEFPPEKGYWQPLTWISHMMDVELYGVNAKMHHRMNLLIHIANTLLLFAVFRQMTGAIWQSALVAALFAVHPMNVESVAWISERKNVFSTFFWMLCLLIYGDYARRPGVWNYLLLLILFMIGLMVKPMLVTLPCVLLLLDIWPLKRTLSVRLIIEKIPFFIVAFSVAYLSSLSIDKPGVLIPIETVPISLRIENALVSYIRYIGKLFVPYPLAIFYPFPKTLPFWKVVVSALLIGIVSGLFLYLKRKPFLIIGWLWYLGTMVPVIGLKQAGLWPSLADRWAYIPYIGLYGIIAWGVSEGIPDFKFKTKLLLIAALVWIAILTILTNRQVRLWENSMTLFHHAIEVTENNALAYNNLASELIRQGKRSEAMPYLKKGLQIEPINENMLCNIGIVLASENQLDEALVFFQKALRIRFDFELAHNNIGITLVKQGKVAEAIPYFQKAVNLNPYHAEIHFKLADALAETGRISEAIDYYERTLKLNPEDADAHNNLGTIMARQGKYKEAAFHFKQALTIKRDPIFIENLRLLPIQK